ncbi:glycosyltransferase [Paenibacillus sp. PR3]|uniref:Glycosyltransferase n=1 Tax=Paenibacillus terricola TaxID=2763503 RepID=A0ABR8N0N9_9BACL|nr:glycosyltransferase [Paenibacillus terricola]MBD3920029.1 glycosyltransferase [Paenibacillus terricola]
MQPGMPMVSIIIPFYNCPYVDQAITSALNQTYPNVEIIVVDDGSTMHQDKLAPYLNRIHYIGKANGGTASALNYGMSLASGKYVAWLSSDDQFKPTKVERQVAFMEAIGAQISYTDFDILDQYYTIVSRNASAKYPSMRALYDALLGGCPINGCTVMMTKQLFTGMGGFNDQLPYTHDYELWIRVVLAGFSLPFINESLTVYRKHPGMGTQKHYDMIVQEARNIGGMYRSALTSLIARTPG